MQTRIPRNTGRRVLPVVKISTRPRHSEQYAGGVDDYSLIFRSISKPEDFVQNNIYALFIDEWGKVLGYYHLGRGSQLHVQLDISLLLNICLALRCTQVVLGHFVPHEAYTAHSLLQTQFHHLINALRLVGCKLTDYLYLNHKVHSSLREEEGETFWRSQEEMPPNFLIA